MENHGYIYFITDGEAVKIGFSEKPLRRLGGLQSGHPKPLRLIGAVPASVMEEVAIHKRFDHIRIRGEWFRETPELIDYANKLCAEQRRPPDDGKAERAALKKLAERYKGNSVVTVRAKMLIAQMNNIRATKDEAVAERLRASMKIATAELQQVLQDGGQYVPANHCR